MAKIQFGSIVTDIRGKLGGQVFKKTNTGHAITRKGAPPRNTLTKSNKRFQRVLQVSRSYRDLSVSDKTYLKAFAIANPSKDVFGNDIILSARAMYQKLVCNLSDVALTKPDFSTLSSVVPVTDIDAVEFDSTSDNLNIYVTSFTSDVDLKIWVASSASKALSAEVNKKVLFGVKNITSIGISRLALTHQQIDILLNDSVSHWCGIQFLNESGFSSTTTWYLITKI